MRGISFFIESLLYLIAFSPIFKIRRIPGSCSMKTPLLMI